MAKNKQSEAEVLVNEDTQAPTDAEINEMNKAPAKANKTVVTNVEMEDGKVVAFPGKRKLQVTTTVTDNGELHIREDFLNGRVLNVVVTGALLSKFVEFGASQKCRDVIAGEDDLDSAILDSEEFFKLLESGKWSEERAKGTGSSAPLHKAVMEVTGKSAEEVKVFLAALNQTQKLALRKDASIAPIIERLEAAKKAKQPAVDTASLLQGLMG